MIKSKRSLLYANCHPLWKMRKTSLYLLFFVVYLLTNNHVYYSIQKRNSPDLKSNKKITKNCNIPQKNHKTDKTIKTSSSVKENLLVRIISWLALARTHHKVNKNPPLISPPSQKFCPLYIIFWPSKISYHVFCHHNSPLLTLTSANI